MTSRRRHPRDDLPIPDEEKGRFVTANKQRHDSSHYQTLPAASNRRSEHQGFTTRPRTTEKRREAQASISSRDARQPRSPTGHGGHKNSDFEPGWNEGRAVEHVTLDTRSAKPHRRSRESGGRQTRGSDVREVSKSIVADQREGRRHDSEKVRRREKEAYKRGDGGRSRSESRRYVEDRGNDRWKAEVKQVELIQQYPDSYATVEATSPRQMDAIYTGEDLYYSSYTRGVTPEVLYYATDDRTARVSARANKREQSSRHAAAERANFHQPRWTESYGPAYDSTQNHGDVRHREAEGQLHLRHDLDAIRDAKPPSYETFQQMKNKGQIRSDYEPASSAPYEPWEGHERHEITFTPRSAQVESTDLPHYKIPPTYPNCRQIPEQHREHVEEYRPCTAPSGVCPAQAIVHRSSRSGEAVFCLISRANTPSLRDGTRSEDAPLIKALLKDSSAAEFDTRPGNAAHPLVCELQRTLRARGERQGLTATMSDTSQEVHQAAPVEEFQEKRSARSWSESDGRNVHHSREDRSGHDYRQPEALSSNDFTNTNMHLGREYDGGTYSESNDAIPDERCGGNQSRQESFRDNSHPSIEMCGQHQGGNRWRAGEMRDRPREGPPRTLHDREHHFADPSEQNAKAAMVGEYRSNVTTQTFQAEFGPSSRRHEEAFGRHLPRPTEWHHLEAIRELDDTGMRQQQQQQEYVLPQPGRGGITHSLAQQQQQPGSDRRTRHEASAPYWSRNSPAGSTDAFDRVNHRSQRELARPSSSYPDIAIIDASDTAITATYVSSKDYVYGLPVENVRGGTVHQQQAMPNSDTAKLQTPRVNRTSRDQVEVHEDTAQRPDMSISSVCQPPNGTDLHPCVPWQAVVGEIQGRVKEVFLQIGLKEKEDKQIKDVEVKTGLEKGFSLSELLDDSSSPKESLSERASRILGISISEETLNVLRREMMAGASNGSQSSHATSGQDEGQSVAKVRENKATRVQEDCAPAGETLAGAAPTVDVPDFDIHVKSLDNSDGVSENPPIIENAVWIQTGEDTLAAMEQKSSQQAYPVSVQDHELQAVSDNTSGDGGRAGSESGGVGAEGGVCSSSTLEEQSETARSSSPREDSVTSCSSSDCSTDTVIIVVRSGDETRGHETNSAASDVYSEAAEAALETEGAIETTTEVTNNEPQDTMARSVKTEPPPLPPHPPPKRKEKRGDVHQSQPDESSAEVPCAAASDISSTWSQDDQDSSFSSDCSGSASGDEAADATPDAHGCRAEIKKKFAKTKPLRGGKQRKLRRQCKAQ